MHSNDGKCVGLLFRITVLEIKKNYPTSYSLIPALLLDRPLQATLVYLAVFLSVCLFLFV